MPDLAALISLLRLASRDRTQLVLENIALRHQLAVYKRSVSRPNITDRDRISWMTVMRMLKDWRDTLLAGDCHQVAPQGVPTLLA